MSKKKFGVILGVILFAALVAVGIWYFIGNAGKDSKDRVYVEKVSAIMGTATGEQNRYSGVVQPQKTVEIKADADREIKEVFVEVGDAVKKDTPLFSYDTDETAMELEQAKLELENQDIEIEGYKKQIEELEKEKKDAGEEEKFEYTTQIQTLETQVKQAEYEKSSKELELEKIQKKIDEAEVLSTSEGVVKSINDGNSMDMEEDSSAFITILSTGEYRVKGTVNEQNIGLISEGADVIIRSRVDEEITWNGVIDSIDVSEPSSSTENDIYMEDMGDGATVSSKYPFYISMEDAEGLILGQHVFIELDEGQMETRDGVWLYSGYLEFEEEDIEEEMDESDVEESVEEVESTEVAQEIQTAFVWADDGNGRIEKRVVELGEYDEELDEYEILSGLTVDDKVAWPMEGLYEGIITVTSMADIDYSSGLYEEEMGEEEMDQEDWEDEEETWEDEEDMWEDDEDTWEEDEEALVEEDETWYSEEDVIDESDLDEEYIFEEEEFYPEEEVPDTEVSE